LTTSVLEYRSGFKEFRVFKVEVRDDSSYVRLNFQSLSMVVVLEGQGHVEVEGYSEPFPVSQYCSYYLMPGSEIKISKDSKEPGSML
jgi:hypothetical protein